jgi:hypothetical protein
LKDIKLIPRASSYQEWADVTCDALGKPRRPNARPDELLLNLLNLNNMEKTKILCSAQWCVPCQGLKKQLAAREIVMEIKDADDDRQFFIDHGVKSVPTLLVFENGLLLEKVTGSFEILKQLP